MDDNLKIAYRDAQEWFSRVTDDNTPFAPRMEMLAQLPRHWATMERVMRAIAANFSTGDLPPKVAQKRAAVRSQLYSYTRERTPEPTPEPPNEKVRLRNTVVEILDEVLDRTFPAPDLKPADDETVFLTDDYIEGRVTDIPVRGRR